MDGGWCNEEVRQLLDTSCPGGGRGGGEGRALKNGRHLMSAMLRDWRMKAPEGAGYAGLEGMNILESACYGRAGVEEKDAFTEHAEELPDSS